jgi:chromosome partitioning protein
MEGVTRVLAVANQKGGVAKTTTVASLGAAMVQSGRRVLLVDLDPQGCLTFSLGQDPDKLAVSIHEVLLGEVEPSAALVPTSEGMTLLPANIDLAGAEAMLLMRAGREYALKRALAKVSSEEPFDVVIIDCPPSLGVLTLNGLTAADDVIVPLQCETLAHRGVGQFLRTVDDVQQITNADLKMLGALPTLYDSRTTHSRDVLLDVADRYGLVVLGPPIPRGQRLGSVGVDRPQEQGVRRVSATRRRTAQALEDRQGAADLHPRRVGADQPASATSVPPRCSSSVVPATAGTTGPCCGWRDSSMWRSPFPVCGSKTS